MPTAADYEQEILAKLSAAWLEMETLNGIKEPEAVEAREQVVSTLVEEEEARRMLRRAWSTWLLYLQKRG